MYGTWDWIKVHSRRLWVRMILIGALGFVAVGVAKLFGGVLPDGLSEIFGADGLNRLLDMIANSMLAVTTFSVTIMVTVQFNAMQNWTPRAHLVILEDRATQTVLATFLGAYLYALLGIVLLETPYFGKKEVVVLYWTTILVLAVIVFTLGRWILRLQTFGSLIDTARRMEERTTEEFARLTRSPSRWAMPFDGPMPALSAPIPAPRTGYIQGMDMKGLQDTAERHGIDIWLTQSLGRFVAKGAPMAHITGGADAGVGGLGGPEEAVILEIQSEIGVGDTRSIDKDPRFGLIQMSEIGSKALSPGINDPGTAIDIVTRLTRILAAYIPEGNVEEDVVYPNLHLRPLDADDLMEDAFNAIGRDAAGQTEVYLAMLKSLDALVTWGPPGLRDAARRRGHLTYLRASDAITFATDRARIEAAAPATFRDEERTTE